MEDSPDRLRICHIYRAHSSPLFTLVTCLSILPQNSSTKQRIMSQPQYPTSTHSRDSEQRSAWVAPQGSGTSSYGHGLQPVGTDRISSTLPGGYPPQGPIYPGAPFFSSSTTSGGQQSVAGDSGVWYPAWGASETPLQTGLNGEQQPDHTADGSSSGGGRPRGLGGANHYYMPTSTIPTIPWGPQKGAYPDGTVDPNRMTYQQTQGNYPAPLTDSRNESRYGGMERGIHRCLAAGRKACTTAGDCVSSCCEHSGSC